MQSHLCARHLGRVIQTKWKQSVGHSYVMRRDDSHDYQNTLSPRNFKCWKPIRENDSNTIIILYYIIFHNEVNCLLWWKCINSWNRGFNKTFLSSSQSVSSVHRGCSPRETRHFIHYLGKSNIALSKWVVNEVITKSTISHTWSGDMEQSFQAKNKKKKTTFSETMRSVWDHELCGDMSLKYLRKLGECAWRHHPSWKTIQWRCELTVWSETMRI